MAIGLDDVSPRLRNEAPTQLNDLRKVLARGLDVHTCVLYKLANADSITVFGGQVKHAPDEHMLSGIARKRLMPMTGL